MHTIKRIFFNSSFVAKMSQNLKRAQRVQENIELNKYAVQTQAKIKQKVSIESSIQTIQKQMRQQIARSLKNSQNKVIYLIKKADQKFIQLDQKKRTLKQIQQYNNLIQICHKARWEFMVHRQACGFTIKNYQLVTTIYKIPPKFIQ